MEGELIQLDVRTESAEASRLLNDRVGQLQSALAEQGFMVERFDVEHEAHDSPFESGDRGRSFDRSNERHDDPAQDVDASHRDDDALSLNGSESEIVDTEVAAERRLDIKI